MPGGGLVKIFSAWGDRRNCWFVVCKGGSVLRLTLWLSFDKKKKFDKNSRLKI